MTFRTVARISLSASSAAAGRDDCGRGEARWPLTGGDLADDPRRGNSPGERKCGHASERLERLEQDEVFELADEWHQRTEAVGGMPLVDDDECTLARQANGVLDGEDGAGWIVR